jgi:hypothetical protein
MASYVLTFVFANVTRRISNINCVNRFTKEIPNFTLTLLIASIVRRSHSNSEKQKLIQEFERSIPVC